MRSFPVSLWLSILCQTVPFISSYQITNKYHNRKLTALSLLDTENKVGPVNSLVGPNIWAVRRKVFRNVIKGEAKKRHLNRDKPPFEVDKNLTTKATIGISAFFITIGAAIFRLGGRAAFIQFLGLDFITNQDIKSQIDGLITSFDSIGDFRYIGFLAGWIVAKFICIDFFVLLLALSSGVLFGGVAQGTAVSLVCSTLASIPPFLVSRYKLRDRTRLEIDKRPAWRAIDRAISKDGLKTVFVLRLSPLLPIPIGAYNYLYGATSLKISDFIIGLTAASIKPYFLDSYLGVYGKSIMDGDENQNDALFVAILFVLILVGSFSTQLAESTYAEIKKETDLFNAAATISGIIGNNSTTSDDTMINASNNTSDGSNNNEIDVFGFKINLWPVFADINNGINMASKRIEIVIADEWQIIKAETAEEKIDEVDKYVDWNGAATMTLNNNKNGSNNKNSDMSRKNDSNPSSMIYSSSSNSRNNNNNKENYENNNNIQIFNPLNFSPSPNYPGNRTLQSYEVRTLDEKTVKEYTYESLIFGFVLLNIMTKLIVFQEDKII